MGICPTSGIKSCIREDWRKRTKVSNLKLQTCPYAQGYVEFPEYAEPIPGRKLESPNEEYTYGSFHPAKDSEQIKQLNATQNLCTWSGTLLSFRAHMCSCPLAPVRCKYCRSGSRKPLRRFQYYSHLQSKHNAEVIIDGIFTPSTPVRFSPVQKCTLKGLHDKEFSKEVLERIEELEVLERIILYPKTASSETKIFFDKANIIKEQGYYKKAVRYFTLSKQGLKLGLDADGSTTDTYFASMGNLANTYIDMKDYEAGKECYLEILTMHEKVRNKR